jgi:hypothetical protein
VIYEAATTETYDGRLRNLSNPHHSALPYDSSSEPFLPCTFEDSFEAFSISSGFQGFDVYDCPPTSIETHIYIPPAPLSHTIVPLTCTHCGKDDFRTPCSLKYVLQICYTYSARLANKISKKAFKAAHPPIQMFNLRMPKVERWIHLKITPSETYERYAQKSSY